LRSILIDGRAAHRLKPFHKERFAGINKEASRYYATTSSAPSKEREHFLNAQPPRLAKAMAFALIRAKKFPPRREYKALIWNDVVGGAGEFLISA
jgi:hypothetical protein